MLVLEGRKGFDFILKVCRLFSNITIIFFIYFWLWNNRRKIKITNLIKDYGLKEEFLQNFYLNTEEIYKQSNVTVIPSQFNSLLDMLR